MDKAQPLFVFTTFKIRLDKNKKMLKIFQRNLSLTAVKAAGALEDAILNKIKNKYAVSVDITTFPHQAQVHKRETFHLVKFNSCRSAQFKLEI